MKKCPCGNEIGRPRVKPFPLSYVPDDAKRGSDGKKEPVHLLYMGGLSQHDLCWFCQFPR